MKHSTTHLLLNAFFIIVVLMATGPVPVMAHYPDSPQSDDVYTPFPPQFDVVEDDRIGLNRKGLVALRDTVWSDTPWTTGSTGPNVPTLIMVCWEDPPANTAADRELVRQAIRWSWQLETDLAFFGWEACDVSSQFLNATIRIEIEDDTPSVREIGSDFNDNGFLGFHKPLMFLNFTFQNWGTNPCTNSDGMRRRCIVDTAIHEFGHALGFTHEFNRFDTVNGACEPQGTVGDWFLTNYDPTSVMNCSTPGTATLLSALDIKGVRKAYGPPTTQLRVRYGGNHVRAGGFPHWNTIRNIDASIDELAFGQFDGGTNLDLVVADGLGFRYSSSGNARLTDTWTRYMNTIMPLESVRFGNFDGNGPTDVFASFGGQWQVSFDGTNAWTPIKASSAPVSSLRFGNFDGNNRTDVFASFGGQWQVSFDGTSNWTPINTSFAPVSSLRFGDFDGNSITDVFASFGGAWQVSFDGTSDWTPINISSAPVSSLGFGDFDGDGESDVFGAWGGKWYVSFSGTGDWTPVRSDSHTVDQLRFEDWDGDGDTDILVIEEVKGFQRYARAWQPTVVGNFNGKQTMLGHYNNDDVLDLYIASNFDGRVAVLNGANGFQGYLQPWTQAQYEVKTPAGDTQIIKLNFKGRQTMLGDYDNDGDLDLYVTSDFNGKVIILDGARNFQHYLLGWQQAFVSNFDGKQTMLGHYDDDDVLDLYVASNFDGRVIILDGADRFGSNLEGWTPTFVSNFDGKQTMLGHYNNGDVLDLYVASNFDGRVIVLDGDDAP